MLVLALHLPRIGVRVSVARAANLARLGCMRAFKPRLCGIRLKPTDNRHGPLFVFQSRAGREV